MARSAIGLIPWLGSPAAILLDTVIAPAFASRTTEWLNEIATRLATIEGQVDEFAIADLAENAEWSDMVLQATLIAARTSRGEKRRMLSNAVVNAAKRAEPGGDLDAVFLSMIDVLSPSHVRLLALCQGPAKFAAAQKRRAPVTRSFREIVEALLPEMTAGRYEPFRLDLVSRGLIVDGAEAVSESRSGQYAKLTTALGDSFLRYIDDDTDEER